jgi:2-oxoglutarate dehydrogenase E2 component (dihydrolipoamide succinyltransferase)
MSTEVIMPQLGESVVEGIVGRWLIAEGEAIEEYQPLLEVETDKVNTEIPAPASGILLKILVPEGTTVAAGTVLAFIGQPGELMPQGEDGTPDTKANGMAKFKPSDDERRRARPSGQSVITPVVSKIAAEHGIDLASVDIRGSGRGGRVTKKDILAHIERIKIDDSAVEELPPWEQPGTGELFKPSEEVTPADVTSAPPVSEARRSETPRPGTSAPLSDQVVPLTSMRQAIAEHMVLSVRTSPHVTTVMEADMSRIIAYRNSYKAEFEQREGLKLTFTPFFVQAVVEGLKAVPEANSSFSDEGIVLHRQINVGLAVALKSGLIVPVVKDADQLSLSGLQRAVSDLAERARVRQLRPDEAQDSTFTITNHGVSGSLLAMPIINQPNAGILGVGAIQKRPVVVTTEGTDSIAIKPMCYLSFTFDHRIMDGALADRFLVVVVKALERWG